MSRSTSAMCQVPAGSLSRTRVAALTVRSRGRPAQGPAVRAVDAETVRVVHQKRYVSGGSAENRAKAEERAWYRHLKDAQQAGLIVGEVVGGKELIWFAKAKDEPN